MSKNKKDLEIILNGLRKVYPLLKSESARKIVINKAKEIKKKINDDVPKTSYEHAKEIFKD